MNWVQPKKNPFIYLQFEKGIVFTTWNFTRNFLEKLSNN